MSKFKLLSTVVFCCFILGFLFIGYPIVTNQPSRVGYTNRNFALGDVNSYVSAVTSGGPRLRAVNLIRTIDRSIAGNSTAKSLGLAVSVIGILSVGLVIVII